MTEDQRLMNIADAAEELIRLAEIADRLIRKED